MKIFRIYCQCNYFACEAGLGGGCDPLLMERERVYFQLNLTTRRAELYGDPQVVSRFQEELN